jgi:hypothetical protein
MTTRFVAHILAKDLRRFWPLVLSAVALMVLSTTLAFYPASVFLSGQSFADAPMILRWFIVIFVAVGAIQDDSADGDRGGWLARPISGAQVFLAKIVLLVVALALPAAVVAAWAALALNGSLSNVLAAALSSGGLTLAVALGASVVAALTGSLLRAIFAGVALGVAYSFLATHFAALGGLLAPYSPVFGGRAPAISIGRQQTVELVGGLGGAIIVLAYQYGRRRTGRAAAAATGLAMVIWLSAYGWPWLALSSSGLKTIPESNAAPLALTIANSHAKFETTIYGAYPAEDKIVLGLQFRQGLAPGGIYFGAGESRLRANDGRIWTMARFEPLYSWDSPSQDNSDDGPPNWAIEALGSTPGPRDAHTSSIGVLVLPRSAYDAFRGVHGKLESWIEFYAYRGRVVGRIPFRAGAQLAYPGGMGRIRSVFQLPNGRVNMAVDTVRLQVKSPFESATPAYFLVNVARNEIASGNDFGEDQQRSGLVVFSEADLLSLHNTWNIATRQMGSGIDEEWLQQAELVALQWEGHPTGKTHFEWGEVDLPADSARH